MNQKNTKPDEPIVAGKTINWHHNMNSIWSSMAILPCLLLWGCVTTPETKLLDPESRRIVQKAGACLESNPYCFTWYKKLGITRDQLVLDVPLTKEDNANRCDKDDYKVFFRIKGTEKAGGYSEIFVLTLDVQGQLVGCGWGDAGQIGSIVN